MALAVLLAVVSWHTVTSLGGVSAGVAYGLVIAVVAVVLLPRAELVSPRALRALVAVCLAGLAVAFVVGVPPAYAGPMGVGSDRSNALDVALAQLVAGHYPYAATTYLGNPITPLPGALLLAAPFWSITRDAGSQNLAGVALLLPVLNAGWRLRPRPTLLWALAVVATPEVTREFLIGDDLVVSAVPALAAVAWTLRTRSVLPAVVLGVVTCTRPHMALVLVVTTAAVAASAGWRRAAVVGGTAALAWVALIVPFLTGGLARFSPLHVAAKVTGDRAITPAIVVVALAALAVLVAALALARPSSPRGVGAFCAAVLFAPSVLSLVHGLVTGPGADVDLTLGAAAVPFAVWAAAQGAVAKAPSGPKTRAANRSPISRWTAGSGWRLSGSGRSTASAAP